MAIDAYINDLLRSIGLFAPEISMTITFVVAILADLIFKKTKGIAGYVSLIGFAVTGGIMISQHFAASHAFSMLVTVDPFAEFFKYIILISSIIVTLMSFFSDEIYKNNRSTGEFYSLITGMAVGMFLISGATNLIMIYLALETMSLSSYVLAGYTKESRRAGEASLKYVIFGSLSSGLMIYGMSIMFGLTGSLNLFHINEFLMTYSGSSLPVLVSGLLIIAGMAYKISAVPFHFWTPDVYEGSPVTITAYLSVASKAAGFAVLMRFLKVAFNDHSAAADAQVWNLFAMVDWKFVMSILAVITMTFGNLTALWQTNVKRMLAYSSIAHAGYILMGVTVMTDMGNSSVLLYFFMYMLMNFGAFYVVQLIADKINSEELDDYVGIGYRAPELGTAMTIFMISLTGLPPTAGFIGKLFLFSSVLESGWIWLAVIGVLNSVISLFYYSKVFRNMWVRGVDNENEQFKFSVPSRILLYALALPTLYYGIAYGPILEWAKSSASIFIGR